MIQALQNKFKSVGKDIVKFLISKADPGFTGWGWNFECAKSVMTTENARKHKLEHFATQFELQRDFQAAHEKFKEKKLEHDAANNPEYWARKQAGKQRANR